MNRSILIPLWFALSSVSVAQEVHDWREYFPLEEGRSWRYQTDAGWTFDVVAHAAADRPGFWTLTTTGFRPDDAWPDRMTEVLSLDEEGVHVEEHSWTGKSSGLGGSGYTLRAPLASGRRWPGCNRVFAIQCIDRDWLVDGNATFLCRGAETIRWADQDLACIRVDWSSEYDEKTAAGASWYAPGLGVVRGELLVISAEGAMSVHWDLMPAR